MSDYEQGDEIRRGILFCLHLHYTFVKKELKYDEINYNLPPGVLAAEYNFPTQLSYIALFCSTWFP